MQVSKSPASNGQRIIVSEKLRRQTLEENIQERSKVKDSHHSGHIDPVVNKTNRKHRLDLDRKMLKD